MDQTDKLDHLDHDKELSHLRGLPAEPDTLNNEWSASQVTDSYGTKSAYPRHLEDDNRLPRVNQVPHPSYLFPLTPVGYVLFLDRVTVPSNARHHAYSLEQDHLRFDAWAVHKYVRLR